MPVTILAIESSCDETSVSICRDGKILSNFIANQKVHEQYGGVVPELASRAHMQHIIPVTAAARQEAAMQLGLGENTEFPLEEIDAIAFTQSPGLIGSLLVGAQFAKSLALALNKPLIAVHHMQAHVLANLIDDPKPSFPFLCLTVSGGHTQIVRCNSPLSMEILGTTIDDAAGEAFDKSAKLLGLPYPGGPLIDQYARLGNPQRFHFPEPQVPGLDFSFSGLKTAILYFLQNAGKSQVYKEDRIATPEQQQQFIQANLNDLCASIQERIISILLKKLKKASLETGIKDICIAGGVSANSGLRETFKAWGEKYGWRTFQPAYSYCTDNAGMIAIAAYYKFLAGEFDPINIPVTARTI